MPLSFNLGDVYDENNLPVDWQDYLVMWTRYYTPPPKDMFKVSYIGSINKSRMFPELIDCIGGMKDVDFIVGGSDPYGFFKNNSYGNVKYLGPVPSSKVKELTLQSNVVICMLNPDDLNCQIGLPNKIFEAMAWGRPIIVTKDMYYSNIINKEKCGLCTSYTIDGVRDAINNLKNNPILCEQLSINGLLAARDKYNWDNESKKLIKLYEELK